MAALMGFVLLAWSPTLFAAVDVPEPLQPWVPWVLHGEKMDCTTLWDGGDQRVCSWPSELALRVTETGGVFEQNWLMQDEGWIILPGNMAVWPQEVTVNGAAAPVIGRGGLPAVFTGQKGVYEVRGVFRWDRPPEFLQIHASTALVRLSINGKDSEFPDRDVQGRLWLRKREFGVVADAGKAVEDRMNMRVFRRVVDEIPLVQRIRIEVDVSGKPREVVLGSGVPAGYVPMSLVSQLPAKIETNGRVRVQVRPGKWFMILECRHEGPVDEINFEPPAEPWPAEEVWVFDARNHLRLVEIEGGVPVDPKQTDMPEDWKNLPAHRMRAGEALQFIEKRRGDPEPAPDQLALQRNIWLDFDGSGYTLRDQVNGTIHRGWRLEMMEPVILGQVMIDGQGQFITRMPSSERSGVEIRQGLINLAADSRLTGRRSVLPAVGWDHDFQSVNATLHLPPGWRLFEATGVDEVPGTWLKRWNLLNLFVVLIIALSVSRLWGVRWGALSLVALVLIYHEPLAPRFVWLHILFAVALLRVLPKNRFFNLVTIYRNISLLALVLISLPFMADQLTKGIFPQLDRPGQIVSRLPSALAPNARTEMEGQISEEEVFDRADEMSRKAGRVPREMRDKLGQVLKSTISSAPQYQRYDPRANVQTGPGLPTWRWTRLPLKWNGPVNKSQTIKLILLSPAVNMVLAFARVVLLGLMIACMFGARYTTGRGLQSVFSKGAVASTICVSVLVAWMIAPAPARAEFPPQALLDQLKQRLLQRPECYPKCADIARMVLEVDEKRLQARFEVDVIDSAAVPFPAGADQWITQQVLVDGEPAAALLRDPQGKQIWVVLEKGRHQVSIAGLLPERPAVQLTFKVKPHHVSAKVTGWLLEGLRENGIAENVLQLNRIVKQTQDKKKAEEEPPLEPGVLPPFVRVERKVLLGLDWGVETKITRLTPGGSAVILEVPLLAGELVTTGGIRVQNGKALINMAARASQVAWSSILEKTEQVRLTAPQDVSWTEVWKLDASPIWHAKTSGIPVVHHQSQQRWLPEWRPWPGESVTIEVMRPEGVEGPTATIDNSTINVNPGPRVSHSVFNLTLRSSQGGQHPLTLPEGATLQAVSINGVEQPIRQEGREVTIPLDPGAQVIHLTFQEPRGMGALFRSPRVAVGLENVNANINLQVPRNRWTLLTGGPDVGPAVLFWGVLLVVVLLAVGLGRTRMTPLSTRDWLLLGIGLSVSAAPVVVLVVGWFFVMAWRRNFGQEAKPRVFNLVQVATAFLTLAALVALFGAIQQGLLGYPHMQIAGNGSSAFHMRWFLDRSGALLPAGWILSIPMFVYRVLMLLWALWLAFALLRWLRWAWESFSTNGVWRKGNIITKPDPAKNPSHTVVKPGEGSQQ
jgi:hypothetical protein